MKKETDTRHKEMAMEDLVAIAQKDLDNLESSFYVRYSSGAEFKLPEDQRRSTDWASGSSHCGLSSTNLVSIVDSESAFALYKTARENVIRNTTKYRFNLSNDDKCWILKGNETGRDSDGAPLVSNAVILGYVPDDQLQAYYTEMKRQDETEEKEHQEAVKRILTNKKGK